MSPRVVFAGLFHETNTFIEQPSVWEDFEFTFDDNILAKSADDSPTAGFLSAAQNRGWRVLPTVEARATPGGPVDDEVFERFWSEFLRRLKPALRDGVDAVFLVLHGAMVTSRNADIEGELISRIRALVGSIPIFGVLDLHANVTPRMCAAANALLAYRKNPHTDAHCTAQRAVALLHRALRGPRLPRMTWVRVPLLWPPAGTGTDRDPMRSLNLLAQETEATAPGIWAFNVTPGFAFADTPDCGLTLSVVSDGDPAVAAEHLRAGARLAWRLRGQGIPVLESADVVFAKLGSNPAGPVVLAEPSDNIGAGAPGDGTGLLRAMILHRIQRGLVAINDPASVRLLSDIPLGGTARVMIGGRGWKGDAGPVETVVTVRSRSDGRFELEDPHSHLASMHGCRFDMGPSTVVDHEGVTILLTSRRTPPFDLGQFHSQGIDVRSFGVIGVKAAVAHRRAYDPISVASYLVDTPGPCTENLAALPYRQLQRPVYPLDSLAEFHCRIS